MPSFALPYPLDLNSTLLGGQSFCWSRNQDGAFSGWIAGLPVRLRVTANMLAWDNPRLPAAAIENYFCLDLNLPQTLGKPWTIPG